MDKFDFRFLVDAMQQIDRSKALQRLAWGVIFVAALYAMPALITALSHFR